jgi:hypothetical protein
VERVRRRTAHSDAPHPRSRGRRPAVNASPPGAGSGPDTQCTATKWARSLATAPMARCYAPRTSRRARLWRSRGSGPAPPVPRPVSLPPRASPCLLTPGPSRRGQDEATVLLVGRVHATARGAVTAQAPPPQHRYASICARALCLAAASTTGGKVSFIGTLSAANVARARAREHICAGGRAAHPS